LTTRPPLSVNDVTVNVSTPPVGDVTVTVHVPAGPVVQGLAGTVGCEPDHVNAIDAPTAAAGPVPLLTVAVIVKTCCVFTGLVADCEIVTKYSSHVLDATAGVLNGMSVNVVPPSTVDPIEVTVNVNVPGPASCTTN
jgi:hypothetical protein